MLCRGEFGAAVFEKRRSIRFRRAQTIPAGRDDHTIGIPKRLPSVTLWGPSSDRLWRPFP